MGSGRREIRGLKLVHKAPPIGQDYLTVAARGKVLKAKQEDLMNEVAVQLSRGHAEITRSFESKLGFLNITVAKCRRTSRRLNEDKEHVCASSTVY